MPGFNPENINIHDLTVEDPEKQDMTFDLAKEVSKEDWELLRKDLETLKKNREYTPLMGRLRTLKTVNPEFTFDLSEEELSKMLLGDLEETRRPSYGSQDIHESIYWPAFIGVIAGAKTIYPDIDTSFVEEKDWKKMEEWLKKRREEFRKKGPVYTGSYLEPLINMKIIKPETELDINEEEWKEIRDALDYFRIDDGKTDWTHFFSLACDIKILSPETNLKLDQEKWQFLKDKLETIHTEKQENVDSEFYSAARMMSILAAEKVEITESGLKITPSRNFSEPAVGEMPESRKF